MAHNPIDEESVVAAWTPDLFGPIFKKHSLTVKQVLDLRDEDEQIHRMATFVPDEVIYATDLSEKSLQSFRAVVMHLNISAEGLLAAWKVRDGEFVFEVVQKAIARATCIQDSIAILKDASVNVAISVGDITFSVIGSDEARHFVIYGLPIEELKSAKKVSLPNDLVLSLSAWQHCTPSEYEYVIKDQCNVKIIRMFKQCDTKSHVAPTLSDHVDANYEISADEQFITDTIRPSSPYRTHLISINGESYSEKEAANKKEKALTAISAIAAVNPNFVTQLRSYLVKPVIQQIEKGELLRYLAEVRRITVLSINIIPDKCSDNELILLVDKCFLLLHSIVTQYEGCINTVNLYEKNIVFCIAFGIRGYSSENQFKVDETCKNGITCAIHILQTLKSVAGIQSAFVGVSTGMAYCGVIGHIARRYYAIIGPPVDKAIKIMDISCDKVSCDYDTVLHSHFKKERFRSRGVRTLQRLEKYHIYEYLGETPKRKNLDTTSSLDYCYPILGRLHELEYFDDILDEIGVPDRKYSGLLIEGIERSGKSRVLDAFVTSVCNRQIRPIKLSLHATYAEKAYSVIYHIILQILEAEDCETVEEREKELLNKLGNVLALEDFCYLNVLMRVRFPLSDAYWSDADWRRHIKTIDIFETILKQLKTKICILLDDIQYMDHKSWQFLSLALDNCNTVVAMTMPKSNSWDDLSHVVTGIYKDKRLRKHILLGLSVGLLPIFACQFLNVLAIPKKLSRTLQKRKDGHIGWCEVFLISILQSNGLDFIKISPNEAAQRDLVFPTGTLVTKLPVDLTPDELPPPLSWSQMSLLDESFAIVRDYVDCIKFDIIFIAGYCLSLELMSEIYDRMNPYEQDFIKCAATLGRVFKRSMIENAMKNPVPLHTTNKSCELLGAVIRSHHLLALYAHCKMLEFRVDSFCNMMYNIQTNEEKQEHHTRAAKIYDARKCSSCGSGRFLRILSDDVLTKLEKVDMQQTSDSPRLSLIRRRTIIVEGKWATTKPKLLTRTTTNTIKQDSVVCRVSIMPTSIGEEDEVSRNEKNGRMNELPRFRKRSASISLEMTKDPSHPSCLEKFSQIDYRNCQCDNIISHLFWRLHQHMEKSGETKKVLKFFIEYSAGMIQIAQPLYAIKLLSIAAERSRAAEVDEWIGENAEDNITDKGIILALMGDAHIALGNYDQAKKYYLSAVNLRNTPPRLERGIFYNAITKIFCKLEESPRYTDDEQSRRLIIKNFELASYLRRLCAVFMINNKLKTAESFALRSFELAFLTVNSFLEKGEIYLTTVRVLYCTRNIKLIQSVERPMLTTIRSKASWNDAEEIAMVANVFLMMYQIRFALYMKIRVLRGELEEAVDMGIKVLKISEILHLNKLMLITLPSLIQIMVLFKINSLANFLHTSFGFFVIWDESSFYFRSHTFMSDQLWTRRVNEAVDLMRQLYFLADEDIDLSAKTWYYALSLDLMLDAGIILESYKTSYNYYEKFIAYRSKFCVWRDPQSLCRLLTNLWMYQLRMGHTTNAFVYNAEKYVKDITWHDFSQILTCSKGFECYLLLLLHCVNTRSDALLNWIQDISNIMKCLKNISKYARVIKPRLYLLMAYLNVLRGRKSSTRIYLYKAQKFATLQENQLMMAWIIQNRRTWRVKVYNNMARYWLEHVGSADIVAWQYIRNFNIDTWSTILYPLPTPDAHL
ncbi:PREDICTED: adenylate cyclase type 10-like [Vollenhovia emeryi]|uniref:adenylate cyclase type 10-like n=1 Tax=Vollenhovia emeryi TaxID=411798 RepID=UPI0005F38EBB|nr:PREDICTED: adenylate cyclase type 10-like [Vollenhovia emeryi]